MAADLVAVLAFVVIGRGFHDDGLSVDGLVATGWPFVVGVVGGWVGIFVTRLRPVSYPAATMVLAKTVILGTVLRAVIQDDETPVSFVGVTTVVLGVLFFGWRAAARLLRARRTA